MYRNFIENEIRKSENRETTNIHTLGTHNVTVTQ